MIAPLAIVVAMLCAAQAAPPAAPVPPAPAPTLVPMDTKGLAPKRDSMQDVQPALAILGRCPASVARAVPSIDVPVSWLSWRVDPDSVALVARGEGDRSAVLAHLRWRGAVIEWHWARASATSFSKAVLEAERVLPWMTVQVTLEGGASALMLAEPTRVQRALRVGVPVSVTVPGAQGRVLSLQADSDPAWAAEAPDARTARLTCAAGVVLASVDAAGRVRVEIEPPGGIAITDLRKQITERQQEMRRASEEERPLIEGEIAQLRAKLVELEALARVAHVPWPPLPTLRVRDASDREFCVLDLRPE
ncbi:MAG: hypothetical protein JNK53_05145 [Phycisphaerae bacterium]|nr:hypothetical protein [Phycisphaerae bacterium]